MLKEVLEHLNLKEGFTVADGTVGSGGHAAEILKRITPGGRLVGIDADAAAIERSRKGLSGFEDSVRLIKDNFRNIDAVLFREKIKSVDAVLLDLGVSSDQIEDGGRGFSIKHNARLDMRMDPDSPASAYEIVNRYKERELDDIIGRYGEERFHSRIARTIIEERSERPIETTYELAAVIYKAVGSRYRKSRIDPATRTFQALRIAVNDELGALEEGLKKAVSWLKSGGRICVISFHSLEDRIVKNLFKGYAGLGILKIITKKPLVPSRQEISRNPRSRSAKLRVAERI
jgi:16S rRNA (cytosine1402-N4)-methyltransferase